MAESASQLVGRTVELEAFDGALDDLGRGRARALELVGEPGIGKTRLLAELRARADARGHLVLSGVAAELERGVPFWVFVDAIDEYVHGLDPGRLAVLSDDARVELGQVFPALGDVGAAPAGGRHRTYRAVRQLLETLARGKPLVLVLDDLHWADPGSAELLGALLRRPPAAPVLLALAVRPRQLPERLAATLAAARESAALTSLAPGALSAEESRRLLGQGLDAAAVETLHRESGGNPFYLQQLARSSARPAAGATGVLLGGVPVPPAVVAALAGELALLGERERRVLEGAAVAGDPFEPELAAAAAGVGEASAVEALDELLRRDLVRHTDVPRRFRFRHPLVRGAVYDTAPGGWRLTAHERSAAALRARGATVLEVAHHVERSARHGDADAIAVLREAGGAAAPRAPATAARLFAAALRLLGPSDPARLDLLRELTAAHAAAGQFAGAHAAVLETLELLPDGEAATRVQLTAVCAGLENLLGRHAAAHARLTRALEESRSPHGARLMRELAVDAMYRMDYASMAAWADRALVASRPLGDRPQAAAAAGILALARVFAGAVPSARRSRDEAAALVDAMPDAELAACLDHAVDTLAVAELHLDDHEAAEARIERSLAIARATGQGAVLPILFWAGMVRTARGRLPDAADVLETAIEIARVSGHAEGAAWNLFARSLAATAAGDVATALAAAEESVALLRGVDRSFPSLGAAIALASASLEAGDPGRAVEALLDAAGGEDLPVVPAVWRIDAFELLVAARLALGRRGDAAETAERARATAAALRLRMARATACRAAATVALDAGDATGAARMALAAAATADDVGVPVHAAVSRTLAGRALARAGEGARAAEALERASATFDACGAQPRRDAAERELGRLGRRRGRRTRRGRPDADGIAALTARELEVARLVVDRRTNPEIAAALFLSPKTVETHMRNLFVKLGVSSRVDVARLVERADSETASG